MRKILLALMCIIFSCTFAGCSSANGVSNIATKFSSIYMAITYDIEALEVAGIDTSEDTTVVKTALQDSAYTYIQQIEKKYISILNMLEENGTITANQKILYKNHLNSPKVGWDKNTYIIEFSFYSPQSSRFFVRYGSDFSGTENAQGFWATRSDENFAELFTQTPDDIISTTIGEYYNDAALTAIEELGNTVAEDFVCIDIDYLFLSTNSRLHSDTATYSEVSLDTGYLFAFDEEADLSFYTLQANKLVWYLFALAITFIFIAIYLVVIYVKKDKKQTKSRSIEDLFNNEDIKFLDENDINNNSDESK